MFTLTSLTYLFLTVALVYWQISRGNKLYAFLWYILCVRVFLKYPQLIHAKRTKFKPTKLRSSYSRYLIGHRGGSCEAPENTLYAFKHALKDQLCSMLEMDVRITKDKQIIVCHD